MPEAQGVLARDIVSITAGRDIIMGTGSNPGAVDNEENVSIGQQLLTTSPFPLPDHCPERIIEVANWISTNNHQRYYWESDGRRAQETGEWFLKNPSFKGWHEARAGTLWVTGMRRSTFLHSPSWNGKHTQSH